MTSSALRRLALSLPCLALLGGCGASAPTHYHTLSRPGSAPMESSGSAQVLVEILPIAVPESLAGTNFVMNDGNGRVSVLDSDRWLAPIADDLRQVVADSLWRWARATDTYQAPVPPASSRLPRYRLAIRVERFDTTAGQSGIVAGSWTLRHLPDGMAQVCRWSTTQPLAGTGAAAAADALAQASQRLADQIGKSLRRAVDGGDDPCG